MAISGASDNVRLMAMEIVVADMLATVYRSTSDPLKSIATKRARFRWFCESNKADIGDSTSNEVYPEEVQAAVDQIFGMAEVLLRRQDLT